MEAIETPNMQILNLIFLDCSRHSGRIGHYDKKKSQNHFEGLVTWSAGEISH